MKHVKWILILASCLLWQSAQAQVQAINRLTDIRDVTPGQADGQVMIWNDTTKRWEPGSNAGSGLGSLADDATPQLGGDLDPNGHVITSPTLTGTTTITNGSPEVMGPLQLLSTSSGKFSQVTGVYIDDAGQGPLTTNDLGDYEHQILIHSTNAVMTLVGSTNEGGHYAALEFKGADFAGGGDPIMQFLAFKNDGASRWGSGTNLSLDDNFTDIPLGKTGASELLRNWNGSLFVRGTVPGIRFEETDYTAGSGNGVTWGSYAQANYFVNQVQSNNAATTFNYHLIQTDTGTTNVVAQTFRAGGISAVLNSSGLTVPEFIGGGAGVTGLDIDNLDDSGATDGQVPTSDGAGGVAWETPAGGGSGAFSDASDPVVLNTTTKDVAVGAAQINSAKLSVDGDADQEQFVIQAHSTQTSDVMAIENSAGTKVFDVDVTGVVTADSFVSTASGGGSIALAGSTSGTATLQAPATGGGTVTLPSGTATVAAVGGAIGAATATTASAGDDDTSVATTEFVHDEVNRTIYINAGAFIPNTTSGAEANTVELATNDIMVDSLDFDASTDEFAGAWFVLPSYYQSGTVAITIHWTAASGSGDVYFSAGIRAYPDSEAIDQAVTLATSAADTLLTANDMHIGPVFSSETIQGTAAANAPCYLRLSRDADNGNDTLAVDAKVTGITIQFP
jgi:hypothetical protein